MSKQIDFNESSIVNQYGINLCDSLNFVWVDTRTANMYRVLFTAIADVLKTYQNKNKTRIGFKMKDDKGNFMLGAVLNYRKPDESESEDTGNWYLEFTFYEEDMTDLVEEYDNHSDVFVMCANQELKNIANGRFNTIQFMYNILNTCITTLIDWLDVNANEAEEVELTLAGVFTASVAVENGVKVMSIVPGEVIKQVIKADSIL